MLPLLEKPPTRWGVAEVLSLSWPASLTMLNSTLMRFVDGWLVSFTGSDAVGAQFVGGMTSFIPESFATGVILVVNTYVSQNFGAGRFRRCGLYAWAGLVMAMMMSLLVIPLALLAKPLFGAIYHEHSPEILSMEVLYFRYMLLAMPLTLGARTLSQFFYGVHRPRIVLAVSLVANAFNIVGDYALILGKWGFPRMGLEGAAIATVCSWALLLAITGAAFLSPKMHARYGTRLVKLVRLRHCLQILRVGWAAGVQFTNDIFAWTILIGKFAGGFGEAHLAASAIAMRYVSLSFMPTVGISSAATALVGRYIARGRPDLARKRAHTALGLSMIYMGLCAAAFLIFREPMMALFLEYSGDVGPDAAAMAPEIIRIGGIIMICAAAFQLFDAIGIIYVGALRGAGDTFWPMCATLILTWVVLVGGGVAVVTYLPQLKSTGPWLVGTAFLVALAGALVWRFESGAWQKINLLGTTARLG